MKHLVDLEAAKRNLKVATDDDDDNLVDLLEQASALVLDYLKVPDTTYDSIEVPLLVQAMTQCVLRSLYDDPTADPITAAVESLGRRLRDPALA